MLFQKKTNKLQDGREGLSGRGSEGRLRVCKDFVSLPRHFLVSRSFRPYPWHERTIPLKAASFCSLTADAFSSTDGIQKSFFGSTCIKESRTTFLHNIILALGNANHMNRKVLLKHSLV